MPDDIPYAAIEQNARDFADLLNITLPTKLRDLLILDYIMPGYIKTVKTRMAENLKNSK